MHGAHDAAPISAAVARAAVAWLVELQTEDTSAPAQARQGLQAWLAQHPEHRRAWQRIEAVNGRLRDIASPVGAALAHAMLAPPRSPGRRHALKILTLALFTGSSAWLAQEQLPWQHWRADLRTAVGERGDHTLADGTRLQLNTDTAVKLAYAPGERRIVLLAGELLATTGHADERPFVLATQHGTLRPLGTRFSVRRMDHLTRLDVFEGAVEIRTSAGSETRTVSAGQRASFGEHAIGPAQAASDSDAAWTDGMLVANGMRLAHFLAELARHRRGHLGCDAAVASLRVSGTYQLAAPEAVITALLASLPIQARYLTRYWLTIEALQRDG
ncbi:FecR domain-containing protein [Janthinobacterium lividum]|uniref:FecR domain-containing protein n=1 Tax=Janthinobacterium lividum TaxID=29581 RepID=UPI001B82B034|nr:FecR family protein [Janthinobacterium lividum]MBR7634189.1 FecR family protein [Janthinobacterium lividum]